MISSAEKTIKNTTAIQRKGSDPSFFRKAGDPSFFGETKVPSFFKTPVQAKLSIGSPNDPAEKEADMFADKVVQRLSEPSLSTEKKVSLQTDKINPVIQKKCAACEKEELQKKDEAENFQSEAQPHEHIYAINDIHAPLPVQRHCAACEGEAKLQTKAAAGSNPETALSDLDSSLNASKGSGAAMPDSTRQQMESSFGADFSKVRIHTGGEAVRMSNNLQAHAFAHGNDIYFNEGKYHPGTSDGQRLLAHELTHTIQQGASGASGVQGDLWDDAANAYNSTVDTVSAAASDVTDTVAQAGHDAYNAGSDAVNTLANAGRSAVDTAVDTGRGAVNTVVDAGTSAVNSAVDAGRDAVNAVTDAGRSAVSAVTSAADAVADAGSAAVDWLTTEAAQAALAGANRLIGRFGGGISIVGTSIVITLPSVNLFTPMQIPVTGFPKFEVPICFLGGGVVLGPVALGGALCVRLSAQPAVVASIGPGVIRNASITLDPLAGNYSATGELYVAAAMSEVAVLEGALRANGLVGTIEPPLALIAAIEGGLRATLRGSSIGAIQETVTLGYSSGAISLDLLNTLKLGVLLEADLDLFANASVYNLTVCEYVWPVGHVQTGKAEEYSLPITIGYGGGGPPVTIGPVDTRPIPVTDIEVAINRTRPQTRCLSIDDIIADLCKRGILPPIACPAPGSTALPGTPGPVPAVGPGPGTGPAPVIPGPAPVPVGPAATPKCHDKTPSGTIDIPPCPNFPGGDTIKYKDNRGKHSQMAVYSMDELKQILNSGKDPRTPPDNQPCVDEFMRRIGKKPPGRGDTEYGGQLDAGSNSKSTYETLLLQVFTKGRRSARNPNALQHRNNSAIGVELGGNPTANYFVLLNELRGDKAHIIPGFA